MIWPTTELDTDSGSLGATKVAFEVDLSEVNYDLQLGSQCTQVIKGTIRIKSNVECIDFLRMILQYYLSLAPVLRLVYLVCDV